MTDINNEKKNNRPVRTTSPYVATSTSPTGVFCKVFLDTGSTVNVVFEPTANPASRDLLPDVSGAKSAWGVSGVKKVIVTTTDPGGATIHLE
jgi:hypothetical protein